MLSLPAVTPLPALSTPQLLKAGSFLQVKTATRQFPVSVFPKSRKVKWGSQGRKRGLMQSTHVYKRNTQLYNGKAQFEVFVKQASSGLKCQHFSPFYVVGE